VGEGKKAVVLKTQENIQEVKEIVGALNLRKLYLLNTNYADLSFLFTILPDEKTNAHLGTEYWLCSKPTTARPTFSTCIPATLPTR
jgi:hypothetical protein